MATQPAQLEPPNGVVPVELGGAAFSPAWRDFFQGIADRLNVVVDPLNTGTIILGPTAGVIMQTGTGTSDPAGLLSVTLPTPYTTRTLGFQCDAHPAEPQAYFNQGTVTALPLDIITGMLSKDVGGGTIVPVPNAPFTWFATGV